MKDINKTIYIFNGEGGQNSPNYLTRVEPVGPGFKDPIGKPVDIQPGDVLLKVGAPGEPWFALFRDQPVAQEDQRDESTAPGLDKEPASADIGEGGESGQGGSTTTGDDKAPETDNGTDDAKEQAEQESTAQEEIKEKQLESATV